MKNKILLTVLIFFLIFCFAIFLKSLNTSSIYVPEKSEKRELPEFVATELFSNKEITSNEIFKDSDFYILNIWASWCAPCREEHPQLMELSSNLSVKIIGLNYKDNPKKAKKFLKELGNPFSTTIIDKTGIIAIEFGGYGIPETFIINKDKKIIKTFIGNLTEDALKEINSIIK
jgi:cytochrome c biogenesis protein CcmG/thiol:disulfide interchange protein DsbE|tara:strand:+ start:1649 stop:2170 length:522 start_codon:yes stop_codon:yes gene_type:complete